MSYSGYVRYFGGTVYEPVKPCDPMATFPWKPGQRVKLWKGRKFVYNQLSADKRQISYDER